MSSPTQLADSLTLPCGQVLANRLMKSALSEALGGPDGAPSARLERLYSRWSTGGYGLVVTGNVMVDRRHLGEPGNVAITDDRHADELARWAKGFSDGGGVLWMQLNHPGRQANALVGRSRPVAPSAVGANLPGFLTPRALASEEVTDIVARFATAAVVAQDSGFDGVQVHAAHGYLVSQFLSPLVNQRDDEWGGDPERRRRFLLEVVRAIRAAVRPSFAVGIKLNSADFQRGGFSEEESREVVAAIAQEGVDLVEISGGSYESPAMMGTVRESTRARESYFLEYAQTVRELAGAVPLAVTGGFRTRTAMAEAVGSGDCDVIGLGRPTATNPDAAVELLEGGRERLETVTVRAGARALVGRVTDLRGVDGLLDLQWHTDQLHRLGDGKEPDLGRPWWRTAAAMAVRNGPGALVPRRRG